MAAGHPIAFTSVSTGQCLRVLINRDNAPRGAFGGAVQVVHARYGAGIDREAKNTLRIDAERDGERGPDGPAMNHRDDVAAGMLGRDARHGAADSRDHVLEALAARRPLGGGRMPEPVIDATALCLQLLIGEALPVAEMLLRQLAGD